MWFKASSSLFILEHTMFTAFVYIYIMESTFASLASNPIFICLFTVWVQTQLNLDCFISFVFYGKILYVNESRWTALIPSQHKYQIKQIKPVVIIDLMFN